MTKNQLDLKVNMEKRTLKLPHIRIATFAQIHSLKLTGDKTDQWQVPTVATLHLPRHINFQKWLGFSYRTYRILRYQL